MGKWCLKCKGMQRVGRGRCNVDSGSVGFNRQTEFKVIVQQFREKQQLR